MAIFDIFVCTPKIIAVFLKLISFAQIGFRCMLSSVPSGLPQVHIEKYKKAWHTQRPPATFCEGCTVGMYRDVIGGGWNYLLAL